MQWLKIVLQYNYCITGKEKVGLEILYCNTPLYCDMSSLAARETVLQYRGLAAGKLYSRFEVYCDQQ